MEEQVKSYKEVSIEIIKTLKNEEYENLDTLLDQRQNIINENSSDELKQALIASGILELDKEINYLFILKTDEMKISINEYKKLKAANISYSNSNKSNLNIFNKKV